MSYISFYIKETYIDNYGNSIFNETFLFNYVQHYYF